MPASSAGWSVGTNDRGPQTPIAPGPGPEPVVEPTAYGVDALILPGKGEGHPRCGTWSAVGVCDGETRDGGEETHVIYEEHRCGRRSCPSCWSTQWAGPLTVRAVSRLGAARHAAEGGVSKRAVHATFSPPPGVIEGVSALFDRRSDALALAKEHGVSGGLVVPHAFRATLRTRALFVLLCTGGKRDVSNINAEKPKGQKALELLSEGDEKAIDLLENGRWDPGEDGGLWKWIRRNDDPWREQVGWSPHYHVVGLCRDFKASDPEADGGWISKNIGALDRFEIDDRDGYESMARVVRYQLSHATFPEEGNRQVLTWFGGLHGSQFDPAEAVGAEDWERIQDTAERVVGSEVDRDGDDGGLDDDAEACGVDGCPGEVVRGPKAIGRFLDNNRRRLSERGKEKARTVRYWLTGDVEPPPGLMNPRTEDEAREAFACLMGDREPPDVEPCPPGSHDPNLNYVCADCGMWSPEGET